MLQSSQLDGVAFDPFSLQKHGVASAEVDVGWCQVLGLVRIGKARSRSR